MCVYSNDVNKKNVVTRDTLRDALITLSVCRYNGKVKGEKIYLSVLGMVYDVSKGKQYYAEGAGYHIFAGRDGAVPFVTGNFTVEEAAKSTDVLSDPQLFQLKMWDDFYKGEDRYPLVGKVIGIYFDSDGNPTDELRLVRKRMNEYVPPPIPKRRQPKMNKNAKSKGSIQAKAIKGEGAAKTA